MGLCISLNVIEKELKMIVNTNVEKLFNIFDEQNYELYLVGGAIRNSLVGLPIKDYDFTTNATPTQMREIVECYNKSVDSKDKISIIPTGERYGTLTFRFHNINYEITTFRKDGVYSDGRRPDEVSFSNNIYEDLSRRDFTINAMAYNPKQGIIDPYCGQADIEKHIIRTVGNPNQRFNEDALRMMRALRFAYKLGFNIDKDTSDAIITNAGKLSLIANERINVELMQILEHYCPRLVDEIFYFIMVQVFRPPTPIFFKWNIFSYFTSFYLHSPIERLVCLYWITQKSRHVKEVKKFFSKLKFDNHTINRIANIISLLNKDLYDEFLENNSVYNLKVAIKKWLFKLGEEDADSFIRLKLTLRDTLLFFTSEEYFYLLNQIISCHEPYTYKHLAIDGTDITSLGFKGEKVGKILKVVLEYVWEHPEHNNKKDLIAFIHAKKFVKNA